MIRRLLFCFVWLGIMVSCNQQSRRIVSDEPIKSNIMGIELGSTTNSTAVERAFSKETGKWLFSQQEKIGNGSVIRVLSSGLDVYYGGTSWTYIDVQLDKDSKVFYIGFVSSYESLNKAKNQFEEMKAQLFQKYGQENNHGNQSVFWTDDTNLVGVSYEESSAINGNDRSFCTLYYVNIALSDAFERSNAPDI